MSEAVSPQPTRGLNRALSKRLTPLFLKTALTPNHVTVLSLGFGILSGCLLSQGGYWASLAGTLCFTAAAVLDNCDGEIARAKNMKSRLGGWLDVSVDLLNDIAFFAGLAAGTWKQQPEGPAAALGILAVTGCLINFSVVLVEKKRGFGPAVFGHPQPAGSKRQNLLFRIADAVREGDSAWFTVIFAAADMPHALLWIGALYVQILWLSALAANFRWIFGLKTSKPS